ncbi:MAG: hypothetical protein HY704_13595 [Gemmatimonadetes bacterium]|nr:hypothetical protein [Gemmatimonadota bacterium]
MRGRGRARPSPIGPVGPIGLLALLAFAALAAGVPAARAQTHFLIVSGLSGEPRLAVAFHEWATTLMDAAEQRLGVPPRNIVYLAESADRDVSRIQGLATRETIERELSALAERAGPEAAIAIVLMGHGSAAGEPRLNLPGPDLTADDLASWLVRFPTQRIVVVNTASASGDWIPALSGERRVVITATRSASERYETMFPRWLVAAFASDGADTDKDGRVSLLEAFEYARREVARAYQRENRLLTEHALLDDDGDGRGSHEPDPRSGDGPAAARIFLDAGARAAAAAGGSGDPGLAALYAARDSLERVIAEHRAGKDRMVPERYEQELERLLLELARVGRSIQEREGRRPR